MRGRLSATLLLFAVLNSALASDYVGRLGAADEKGGDPKLVGVDTNVSSSTDNVVNNAPVNDESVGASSDRPLSPGDPAPLTFNNADTLHTLEIGVNRGSAIYIGDGVFLTAGHMLENSSSYVTKIDGKQHGGKLNRIPGVDLAWLQLTKVPEMPAARATLRDLKEGERLTCYGKLSGKVEGIIAYDRVFKDGSVWLDSPGAGIIPGDSGGGAFDSEGNLVAILIGDATDSDHVFVMPLNKAGNQFPTHPNITSLAVLHPVPHIKYLLFSASWCMPCMTVKQTVLPKLVEKGYNEDSGNLQIIDIDKEHDLAVQYDVLAIPLWVILKDGKEIGREQGGSVASLLRRAAD